MDTDGAGHVLNGVCDLHRSISIHKMCTPKTQRGPEEASLTSNLDSDDAIWLPKSGSVIFYA